MKKIPIVFLLSCFFLIQIGCSKNSDDTPTPVDKTANLQTTGASANDLLSNDTFTKLKIEIAYVNGFRPTNTAMNAFVDYVRKHTFKQDIELVYSELESPEEETLTLDDIVQLESDNRTVYNNGDTLGVYIYFTDAPSDGDDQDEGLVTLGAVYRNTSMVIYEETIKRFANLSSFIATADIESATINHEFGHLFGLVDLGSEQVNEHEDPEAESHCIVPGCLMRAEIQFNPSRTPLSKTANNVTENLKAACSLSGNSVLKILNGSTAKGQSIAPDLDPECILDLRANGGR